MKLKDNQVISTVSELRPYEIVNTKTGEVTSESELAEDIESLLTYVHSWATEQLKDFNELDRRMKSLGRAPAAPAEASRQAGYQIAYKDLPKEVLSKSRVNKLAGYLLTSAYRSYIKNPNPGKQLPHAGWLLNLGAVDQQFASLVRKNDKLILTVKLWLNEYTLKFNIPKYMLKRDISKWSLPVIRQNNSKFVFDFTTIESVENKEGSQKVGIDLGIIQPYQAVVLNEQGSMIAEYKVKGHAKQLTDKLKRVNRQFAELTSKIERLETYGNSTTKLAAEAKRVKSKRTRLKPVVAKVQAACLIKQLNKHDVDEVALEDLRWVTGKKYGGRWDHSVRREAIAHRAKREGLKVRKVNPRDTSQVCSKCESQLKPKSKRQMYCRPCDKSMDRDVNAAVNIAKKTIPVTIKSPGLTRVKGEVKSINKEPFNNALPRGTTPTAVSRTSSEIRGSTATQHNST